MPSQLARTQSKFAIAIVLGVLAMSGANSAGAALSELGDVTAISAGDSYACALTVAGGVKCWSGNNQTPATIVPGLSSGATAIAVGRGGAYSCAIKTSGGVRCWNGPNGSQAEISGLDEPVVSISASFARACAIQSSGSLKCWAPGNPEAAIVPGLASDVVQVSVGIGHTCVVVTGGGVKCWGSNDAGQLGDGTKTNSPVPVDVSSLTSDIVSVHAGGGAGPVPFATDLGGYSCAVSSSGGAKCWGSNSYGQLGDGTLTAHLTPFEVLGLGSGVIDFGVGGTRVYLPGTSNLGYAAISQSCAVTADGSAKCWGPNYCSMVGPEAPYGCPYPSHGVIPAPRTVLGLSSGVTAIAAGGTFTCALMEAKSVKCWGLGFDGVQAVLTGTLSQAIVFGPSPTVAVSGTGVVTASGGGSGNPIVFTSLSPLTCSVSGSTVSGIARGLCTIAANQAGSDTYDPAPQVSLTFMIGDRFGQIVEFGVAPSLSVGGTATISASSSSGLGVTISSNTPSKCSVSGNQVLGLSAGTCTLAARQSGNIEYAPSPEVTQNILVSKGVQVISYSSAPPKFAVPGGSFTLAASGGGSGNPVTFSIDSASSSGACSISGSTVSFLGLGTCIVSADQLGSVDFLAATPVLQTTSVVLPAAVPRLANISTRMQVLTGADVLIGGFIIGGSQPKTVVVRARGPSLIPLGVPNALANPVLQLFSGSTQIDANDNWREAANQAAVQSSGFAPSNDLESAILATLNPGAYTAIVTGAVLGTGVALIEVFEVDLPQVPLLNISTRGKVLNGGDVMIGGFIIQGDAPQTVVVRARGPTLTAAGVPGALQDPVLQLYSGQTVIVSNDDWQTASNAAQIQSAGFAPSDSRESAILITLNPGAYTAIVTGKNGSTGVGIIEVFAQ